MNDAMLAMVVAECQSAVDRCEGSIEDKARAAMMKAKDHWMVLDPDVQFRGAVGALLIHYGRGSPEYERIEAELNSLQKLLVILQAARAGLSVNLTENDMPKHESLGLMKMWHEVIGTK